jgi:hypothetical protein
VETSVRLHPLATTLGIAAVAFVAGTIAGSRLARSLVAAAAPIMLGRLLDGPLGDDLAGYVKSVFRAPVTRTAS